MDKIRILGGESLSGSVKIEGAKNAVLPIFAATMLCDSPSVIRNVPPLSDVKTMLEILRSLGADCQFDEANREVTIDPCGIHSVVASYDMVRKMRASICVLGPLIGRFGKARVSFPGGCVIGQRPVDLHIKGLRALNVDIKITEGYIEATADHLRGSSVFLGGRFGSSVLATANIMLAAVKADGVTVIESAACEPEIVDLANILKKMGAEISGAGTHSIRIKGVDKLVGVDYSVIPDRIEAGTFILAAAITRSCIEIENVVRNHLLVLIDNLLEVGIKITGGDNRLKVDARFNNLSSLDITTLPYPGFPTDLQAQMMAFLTTVSGISVITEKIFSERFMHIAELNRMSADISLEKSIAIVKGGTPLSGAPVMASDLRASAALVLAGLVADGVTVISRIYHLDRGYYKMEEKLQSLGANIERLSEEALQYV